MAVISSSDGPDAGVIFVRNAVLRMLVARALANLEEAGDNEGLECAGIVSGVTLSSFESGRRKRIIAALLEAIEQMIQEIAAGLPVVEEPVRPGIEEKLEGIRAFLKAS